MAEPASFSCPHPTHCHCDCDWVPTAQMKEESIQGSAARQQAAALPAVTLSPTLARDATPVREAQVLIQAASTPYAN